VPLTRRSSFFIQLRHLVLPKYNRVSTRLPQTTTANALLTRQTATILRILRTI
jgi:hypothetical protein